MSNKNADPKTNIVPNIKQFIEKLENDYKKKIDVSGFSTGFKEIDCLTGGLSPKTLWVVTGRPGMGKTAFVVNLATHASIREKKKVAFFSCDHTAEDITARMVSVETKVDYAHSRFGRVVDSAWPQLITGVSAMNDADSIDVFEQSNQ